MISIMPNTTASDIQGVLAILDMLPDDKKHRERLNALISQVKLAEEAADNSRKSDASATEKLQAAEKLMADVNQTALSKGAEFDRRGELLKEREDAVRAGENDLIDRKKKLDEDFSAAFSVREKELKNKQQELAVQQSDLQINITQHEENVKKSKAEAAARADALKQQESIIASRQNSVALSEVDLKKKHVALDTKVDALKAAIKTLQQIIGDE